MIEQILRHGVATPDRLALVHRASRITYAELAARVDDLARGLTDRGLAPGDRVVILIPMSIDLYVVLLAVASLGAVAVFVEPASGLREIARAIRTTRPAAFIGIPRAHLLRALVSVPLAILAGPAPLARALGAIPLTQVRGTCTQVRGTCTQVRGTSVALLTFSSGSTGVPKAATRTHDFLKAQHEAMAGLLDAGETPDVHMSAFAIVLLSTLVSGGTAVIPPMGKGVDDVDGDGLARIVEELGVTVISGSPAFLAPMIEAARTRPLASVRRVISGGAPVPVDLCEAAGEAMPHASFLVVYGSTEAEPISMLDASVVRAETAAKTRAGAGLCVGETHPHVTVRLIGPSAAPLQVGPGGLAAMEVAPGDIGEVVVTGPHVNQRYYRNAPAERANKIVDERGAIWHRTGDAAYRDERGRLWLVGRISDTVRRGDAVYHPSAVEAAARTLPWVARAALVGDGRGGTLLVVEPRGPTDAAALTRHLASSGVVVDRVALTRTLPVDPRHRAKIDYPAVRKGFV